MTQQVWLYQQTWLRDAFLGFLHPHFINFYTENKRNKQGQYDNWNSHQNKGEIKLYWLYKFNTIQLGMNMQYWSYCYLWKSKSREIENKELHFPKWRTKFSNWCCPNTRVSWALDLQTKHHWRLENLEFFTCVWSVHKYFPVAKDVWCFKDNCLHECWAEYSTQFGVNQGWTDLKKRFCKMSRWIQGGEWNFENLEEVHLICV